MKISLIFQHIIASCLAISLLSILFYTNTINDPDEIENNLRSLSRQASSLNLEINQTVCLLQFGGIANYDLLSQQTTTLKGIQQGYKQSIKNLDNNTMTDSFTRFNQQLEQKLQLIETFKSQHALYNNAQLFLLKLLAETKNDRSSSPPLEPFIQQLKKMAFQNIYQNSTIPAQQIIKTIQQSSQFKHSPLLMALTQQAQTVIINRNKSKIHASQIIMDKTTLVFEQLEREISQYYSVEHKKFRAIQNILFLAAILSITYTALRKSAKTK